MEKLSLNGEWQFTGDGMDKWLPGEVPGDVFTDLIRASEIPDPYYGKNELVLQWVGKSDWVYKKEFAVGPELLGREKVVLDCRGLDTVAGIVINGQRIGRTENAHRRYEFDLSGKLDPGENEIRIEFSSAVNHGLEKRKEYPREIPEHRYPVDQPARQFVRKAQCQYGWDWGPCFPTVGIWRDITIRGFSVPRIRYTITDQEFDGNDVKVGLRAGFDVPRAGRYKISARLSGEETGKELSLKPGYREENFEIDLKDPELWWPRGYGDQHLHRLRLEVRGDEGRHELSKKIGIRDLKLVRNEDSGGESFYFEVNGTPVFARGANWIPADSFPGRMTAERYEGLLDSAVAANMNALRIWGGGYYEDDIFYELCDEKGILVWQDFMFACSAYPADEEFLENVEREVEDQVRRLADHPSIALWCGDNENEWLGERGDYDRERISWADLLDDYRRLNEETIGRTARREDPGRAFWPSSPSSEGKAPPNDESVGDTHYWDVWHGGKPFSDYLTSEPRFVSEFGYQSFPSTELLGKVMDDKDFNPASPMMEHHQRHPDGNALITRRMADNFRFPFSFEDFVYISQIQQGLAMKTAIEHWRRLKPYCMGTIYWQLNDIWPVASWSSLEYGGGWKGLHYMAKRFYSPLLVSFVEEGGSLEVWVTSDLDERLRGKLRVEATKLSGGTVFSDAREVEVGPQTSELRKKYRREDLLAGEKSEDIMVRAVLSTTEGESVNFHFFERFKSLQLPEAELSLTREEGSLNLKTDRAALFVRVKATGLEGHFDKNFFHAFPGQSTKLSFHSKSDGEEIELTGDQLEVKHLRQTY